MYSIEYLRTDIKVGRDIMYEVAWNILEVSKSGECYSETGYSNFDSIEDAYKWTHKMHDLLYLLDYIFVSHYSDAKDGVYIEFDRRGSDKDTAYITIERIEV